MAIDGVRISVEDASTFSSVDIAAEVGVLNTFEAEVWPDDPQTTRSRSEEVPHAPDGWHGDESHPLTP